MGRWRRWVAGALALPIAAASITFYLLWASRPRLDGRLALPGLSDPVLVSRDGLGVATLEGRGRIDLAQALGFLHGQERFFQMDLLRRRAAGELAVLLGKVALPADRATRIHRFRRLARATLPQLPPSERQVLASYTRGVNQGLADLGARPFEYHLLRSQPEPWREEDCVLTVYAMYLSLQESSGRRELIRQAARERLPAAMYELLTVAGSEWEAPLRGTPPPPLSLPTADRLEGWRPGPAGSFRGGWSFEEQLPGSNSWAVTGAHSRSGAAMLAGDMHLPLAVPNIWYRAQLRYDVSGQEVVVTGVTLPGTPLVVVGSNRHVAWAFTNSQGDWSDVVLLEQTRPGHYRTPAGEQRLTSALERIEVRGASPVTLIIEETVWGPVIHRDARGRVYAHRWVAHDVGQAVSFRLVELEQAPSVGAALSVAKGLRLPQQSFVSADAAGNIGWTIAGAIPRRTGCDASLPSSWADGQCRWEGYFTPEEYPTVLNPPGGRIWTANNRVVTEAEGGAMLGDGGYALGARARQIRDGIAQLAVADERSMLAVQTDDRALLLTRWQRHLLALLDEPALGHHPGRRELRDQVRSWTARASADDAGYRLVRSFRLLLRAALQQAWLDGLAPGAPAARLDDLSRHWESYVWQAVTDRPLHLLPREFRSWREFELAVVDTLLERCRRRQGTLSSATWGEANTADIRHPLSAGLPLVGGLLDAPREPLAGDIDVPRVQGRAFGASTRLVVSPGHEERAIFHMPGGQSGHPLSPFYLAGHTAWVRGEATAFLPGRPRHRLTLAPASR